MSKTDKLKAKLSNGSISAKELRTLLKNLNWTCDRTSGSHEQWLGPNRERFTLATHGKDLKKYQMEEIKSKLKL